MSTADDALFAAVAKARAGVVVDPEKSYLFETRLGPVARREGMASLAELAKAIREKPAEPLLWAVAEALAGVETAFFRDPAAFDVLGREVLPQLAAGRAGRPLKIWSCAAATGQEAWSLAMIADEARPLLAGCPVQLFASDLSRAALEKAASGLYTQFEVQRGLPVRQLIKHFDKVEDAWALKGELKQQVRWARINLLADLSGMGTFDVIACRYVLSSFDSATRAAVLAKLTQRLSPDGWLMLGADERADGLDSALQPAGTPGLFRLGAAARAAA